MLVRWRWMRWPWAGPASSNSSPGPSHTVSGVWEQLSPLGLPQQSWAVSRWQWRSARCSAKPHIVCGSGYVSLVLVMSPNCVSPRKMLLHMVEERRWFRAVPYGLLKDVAMLQGDRHGQALLITAGQLPPCSDPSYSEINQNQVFLKP